MIVSDIKDFYVIDYLDMIDEICPRLNSKLETLYLVRNPADGPLLLGNVTFIDIPTLDFETNHKAPKAPRIMRKFVTDLTLVKFVDADRGKYMLKPVRSQSETMIVEHQEDDPRIIGTMPSGIWICPTMRVHLGILMMVMMIGIKLWMEYGIRMHN